MLLVACIPSKPGRARTLGLLNRPSFAIWSTYLPFWQLFLNILIPSMYTERNRLSSRGTTRHSHERPASRWPYKLGPTSTSGSSTENQLLGHLNFRNLRTILFWQIKSLGRFLHLDLRFCADGVPWLTRALGKARDHVLRCRQVRRRSTLLRQYSLVISFISSNLSPQYDTAFFPVFLVQRGMDLTIKVLQRCEVKCLLFIL